MEDEDFQRIVIERLRYVARERAVRSQGNDEGFTVAISSEDIKSATERERIKQPVLENYSEAFNSVGFQSEVDLESKTVRVFVPPVVDNTRNSFTLGDINQQTDVIQEIRERELRQLIDE